MCDAYAGDFSGGQRQIEGDAGRSLPSLIAFVYMYCDQTLYGKFKSAVIITLL